jgi:hypothetical protein
MGWAGGREAGRGGQEFDRRPEFVADLKALADADLVWIRRIPACRCWKDVVRVSDKVPNLRMVIDHLPQMYGPPKPRPGLL